MYSLRYDFMQYNDIIAGYIETLISKSGNNFREQIRAGEISNKESDSKGLARGIQNLEEYLYYNYKKSPESFNYILNSIINNVKTLSVLPNSKRGIYGETQTQNKIVYINPDLPATQSLTGEERTRLYMAHELGHIINNGWMKAVIEYANSQIRQGRLTQEHAQLVYDGFSMLDEFTTQNRAEDFVYEFSGKRRSELSYHTNVRMFNGEAYRSNFDYYGELQEPAIMFARTLRGIGKENDDAKVLDMLSQRALLPNFLNNILSEYSKDGQMAAFVQEMKYMGLLKRASYANFGYGDTSYLDNSKTYLDKLRSITGQMRDYREPFEDGYSYQ